MSTDESICCFCFEPVPWYQAVELVVFPTPGEEQSQALTCHRLCLVQLVDRRVPLHPDLEAGLNL